MKYSKDKKVSFEENSHSYIKDGNKLLSVTTLISKFKNPFDKAYHSKRIAERENKTQEEILALWDEKAKRSCDVGTAIHKIFEDYTNGNYYISNGEIVFEYLELDIEYYLEFNAKKEIALQFVKDFFLSGRLTPVCTEFIVYNDWLAGQIDIVCVDKNGKYYILDFKTNSKIESYSYGKSMLSPFGKYNDSNFYHYSLQLSIYKSMIDLDISNTYIVHITEEKYNFIECIDVMENIELESLKQYI